MATEAVYWRLPPGLKDRIADGAAKSGRSQNAQAVWLLEEALGEPGNGDNKAGLTAAGRTQGHGAEETEGPGRAGEVIRDPGSASASPTAEGRKVDLVDGKVVEVATGEVLAEKGLCPHRIPLSAFCGQCDG